MWPMLSVLALATGIAQAAQSPGYDKNLLDYGLTPFSDRASHGVLLRPLSERQPLARWTLRSAWAWGADSRLPHPGKDLFTLRLGLNLAASNGKTETLEWGLEQAEDCPRWTYEQWKSQDNRRPVTAEVVTLFPETDCALLLATFKNTSFQKLKVFPYLEAGQALDKAEYRGKYEAATGVFTLKADRSRLFSRKITETVVLVAGGTGDKAAFRGPEAGKEPFLDNTDTLVTDSFSLTLSAKAVELKPGASLRFPVFLSFDPDPAVARGRVRDAWKNWALPKGAAFSEAQSRVQKTMGNLPVIPDKEMKDLAHRACWTLIASEYGRRGELVFPLFSPAKGFRDAFFSLETPLIAMGFAELDWGKAEDAMLQLSSFALAAPLPIPPYTGEGLLFWEAGGFP